MEIGRVVVVISNDIVVTNTWIILACDMHLEVTYRARSVTSHLDVRLTHLAGVLCGVGAGAGADCVVLAKTLGLQPKAEGSLVSELARAST